MLMDCILGYYAIALFEYAFVPIEIRLYTYRDGTKHYEKVRNTILFCNFAGNYY